MNEEDDDNALFLEAMDEVTPLEKGRQQKRVVPVREETPGMIQRRAAAQGDQAVSLEENYLSQGEVSLVEPLAYLEWKKEGVQTGVFAKLANGGYPIERSLDLHRKTVKEARVLLFLNRLARGSRPRTTLRTGLTWKG